MKNEENIFFNFYTTPRLSINLTDEGGPFGLDIHTALEICYLINFYKFGNFYIWFSKNYI